MSHREKAEKLVEFDKKMAKDGIIKESEVPSVEDYMSLNAIEINQYLRDIKAIEAI